MSDIVIKAEGLGKKYTIGHQASNGRYLALRDVVMQNARNLWRTTKDLMRGKPIIQGDDLEEVWALKDVSFEIRRGEAVGIIGRNGAGKSTLLKILSRITEPSAGRITIKGRVASLLEVGTGFHPELTGRENIYLNGAILGMTRAEITRKFDQIVDFSGVERYLDTPVKRYSSGMYVRLAFAVAAHLEPEILLVDEVLAVGDAAFQKKCLGKMGDVASEGRTVLFVSHNTAAILSLCQKAMCLGHGSLEDVGETHRVVEYYQSSVDVSTTVPIESRRERSGNGALRFIGLHFGKSDPSLGVPNMASGCPAWVALEYQSANAEPLKNVNFAVTILDMHGTPIFTCDSRLQGTHFERIPPKGKILCHIPRLPLVPGTYQLTLWSGVNSEEADLVRNAGKFTVLEGDFYETGKLPMPRKHGPVLVNHAWSLEDIGDSESVTSSRGRYDNKIVHRDE